MGRRCKNWCGAAVGNIDRLLVLNLVHELIGQKADRAIQLTSAFPHLFPAMLTPPPRQNRRLPAALVSRNAVSLLGHHRLTLALILLRDARKAPPHLGARKVCDSKGKASLRVVSARLPAAYRQLELHRYET